MRRNKFARRASVVLALMMAAWFATEPARGQAESLGSGRICRLRSEGGYLYDGYGRVVLLRGANVPSHCYKPMKFNDEDLEALERFGFNFVRLGISWDKAEPEPGRYDLDYVDSIVDFASRAGERGFYVMPEVHKYGWCQPGSDWPQWACVEPVKDGSDWLPMMRNARHFWDTPEVQDHLIEFWKMLVRKFRDNNMVMGYNPMNEPLDLSMMIPGVFDRKLFAFYERWITAVRELDPERPASLEPSTANMIIPLLHPPFGHDNLVYAPHPYYVHGDGFKEPETNHGLNKKYRRIAREARSLDAALMVGEYGGDPDTAFARRWLLHSFELQDRYFASAAIWVYDPASNGWTIVDRNREPRPFFLKALRRPYPRFTAGAPEQLHYDVESQEFTYRYRPSPGVKAATEVFVPREVATGSITVTGADWSYDEGSQVLTARNRPQADEVGIEIRRMGDDGGRPGK